MNATPSPIRCAIYTRKSTEEGLEQEFNTLDAQREACENYIRSQKGENWVCLAERYDDGGYTGSNTDRPGLQKLLEHVKAGLIDCVVVYKVDRLSRSITDFGRLVTLFEERSAMFVSVTQQFNTTSSMGRLTLNILLSFAQFEREIIGERIRDKIALSKRKGKHTGGRPILGYDLVDKRLVVNEEEAKVVRMIFDRFLVLRSTTKLAMELNDAGIHSKTQRSGKLKAAQRFTWNKTSLYSFLRNRKYIGEISHCGTIYPGEHEGIVDRDVWDQVQDVFQESPKSRTNTTRTKTPSILKGVLYCGHCGCSMGSVFNRGKNKKYHYYICYHTRAHGKHVCPVKTVPAWEIEEVVVREVQNLLKAPEILAEAHSAYNNQEFRPDADSFKDALSNIPLVWEHLFPSEQARICKLLLDKVHVHPDRLVIRVQTDGLATLHKEFTS